MLTYLVVEGDGRIASVNRVFDPTGHRENLVDNGVQFVEVPSDQPVPSITQHYFDRGLLKPRPPMPVTAEKMQFKADGTDCAVLRGIPDGARAAIYCNGVLQQNEPVGDSELEVSAVAPGTYRVTLECWPYLAHTVVLQAVE